MVRRDSKKGEERGEERGGERKGGNTGKISIRGKCHVGKLSRPNIAITQKEGN